MRRSWLVAAALPLLAACASVPGNQASSSASSASSVAVSTEPIKTDPEITNTLMNLVDHIDQEKVDLTSAQGTPVYDIVGLGSPIGYNLRNRYLNIGVPLAEAFSRDSDPDFRAQLVQLARWSSNAETRAAALLTLARQQNIADLPVLDEALVYIDPAVRFGALEALQVWGHPQQSLSLLSQAADKEPFPVLQVYAAAGLARLGDPAGLLRLRTFLDNPSWLVRAMAARYLGENGTAEDYDRLVSHIGRETNYDFNVAELCIGALKLYPKKRAAVKQAAANADVRNKPTEAPGPADQGNIPDPVNTVYELEPLVIKAPRTHITADMPIDPQINANLLRLLQGSMSARPDDVAASDPGMAELTQLSTVDGYNLQMRYSELGFLLTEGLAGTTDFDLQTALQSAAGSASNVQIRAAALVALAYTKDTQYLPLFQQALSQTNNITVRFAGLESLLIEGDQSAEIQVSNAAHTDPSPAIQLYAAAGMWKMGDIFGQQLLQNNYQSQDWFTRAMSAHYMGVFGSGYEYRELLQQLSTETNPQVQAELCSALLRLQRFKND